MFNDRITEMFVKRGQSNKELQFQQMLLAGTVAGLFQMAITYPLETVRTRMTLSKDLAEGIEYRSIWHCVRSSVSQEGAGALYRGFGIAVLSGAPYVGIQMSLYQMFQRWLPRRSDGSSAVVWKLFAGAGAGVVAQTAMYWGDTLRRRMQTNGIGGRALVYSSTMDCIRKTYQREGFVGFYRGWWANTLKALPNAGIQFVAFDLIKAMLT